MALLADAAVQRGMTVTDLVVIGVITAVALVAALAWGLWQRGTDKRPRS